jgi:hypothetical protein
MWFCAAAAFKTIPHHHCFLFIGCGIGQRVHFHEIFKNFTGAVMQLYEWFTLVLGVVFEFKWNC